MAKVRLQPLRREEVDTVDEVQKAFNDVYRILREQQKELVALAPVPTVAQPVALDPEAPAPVATKSASKKGTSK